MRTVIELLNLAQEYLEKQGVDNSRLEAEHLLGHVLNKKRLGLYLDYNQPLTEKEIGLYREYIRQRGRRKPIQYIAGETEFYGFRIRVNENVLIPRPETELMIEKIVELVENDSLLFPGEIVVFDIGTGSGCIAVALAKKLSGVKIYASDISPEALKVAADNARLNSVHSKIEFLAGDIGAAFDRKKIPSADIVVSNPPYVSEAEYKKLPPEVADFEPKLALDGGEDGLDQIRKIVSAGAGLLKKTGWIFIEIGWKQAQHVARLFEESGAYAEIEFIEDYRGIKRIVRARKA